jgi:tRNA (mo5U34)-methyltransferase
MRMQMLRRAASVFAEEGLAEVCRRAARKYWHPVTQVPSMSAVQADYERQVADFRARTRGSGQHGLDNYFWYHTIDLGNGLLTPGDYDYRDSWSAFRFPEDMTGMSVLDVGSATGFFAFEFERRGADVISVELPSLADWDIIATERDEVLSQFMSFHQARTPEEAYRRHLDGPFQFCRELLGSSVRRCYATVYDLTPARLGRSGFDLIFVGDVLLHLFSPLKALDVLAPLCRGTLITTLDADNGRVMSPLMTFLGRASEHTDHRTWWMPNGVCMEEMLRRVGFSKVSVAGGYSGVARRSWHRFARKVVHASKS